MKRPGLAVASAVVLILLSLLQILMALLMVLAGTVEHTHGLPVRPGTPPPPTWMPQFSYAFAAFCAGLAAWGIITAIGVFRLRRWARTSILIIGGCMAGLGLMALVGTAVSFAALSNIAPAGAAGEPAMLKAGFAIIALFYGALAAIGIFWLMYFNQKTVRAVFAGGLEAGVESRRPLLVSIYAVFSLLGALGFLVAAFIPFPAILFGIALTGWKKTLIYLAYSVVDAAIGVGLWKLAEWARKLALGFLGVGAGIVLAYAIWPSLILRNNEAVYRRMGVARPPMSDHVQVVMFTVIFGLSLLFMIAIAWMLHYYRERFAPPAQAATVAGA